MQNIAVSEFEDLSSAQGSFQRNTFKVYFPENEKILSYVLYLFLHVEYPRVDYSRPFNLWH